MRVRGRESAGKCPHSRRMPGRTLAPRRDYDLPMRIIGHGIDAVEIDRIARSLAEFGDRFLERVFTPAERAYAQQSKRRDEHLAARFAAKEAVFKALGTGWSGGIAWTDVEVCLEPSGRPFVKLYGRAAEIAYQQAIRAWSLSLTHTKTMAIASAIATGE